MERDRFSLFHESLARIIVNNFAIGENHVLITLSIHLDLLNNILRQNRHAVTVAEQFGSQLLLSHKAMHAFAIGNADSCMIF